MVLSPTLNSEKDRSAFAPKTMHEYDENCFKKEDRDELLKHGWQLTEITKKLEEIKVAAKETTTDLEARVRTLENFKWIVWGMGSIVGILIGWVLELIGAGHGK